MALREIEFELSPHQYELMGYPGLQQGQPLNVILDAGVLLPNPSSNAWYVVQPEPLASKLVRTSPATYALSGQIQLAEISRDEGEELAMLQVDAEGLPIRMVCAAREDGMLPFGTWETRYLTGHATLSGLLEDDYTMGLGTHVGVTIWHINRLSLTPGDPHFGQWRESDRLLPMPFTFDRIVITGRVHRQVI
jgi:hypothetical protein